MAWTPLTLSVAAAASFNVLYVADSSSRVIQALALVEAKDGASAPLTHAAGDVAAAAEHGLITRTRRADAAAVLAGVADGDYSDLIVGGDGALWARLSQALPAGTNTIGKLGANSGVDIGDVDVTSIAAGSNVIGHMGLAPRTSGGLTPYKALDIDETDEMIKGSAGQVFGWYLYNAAASARFLKFYDATDTTVVVGTTAPAFTIPLPAGAAANVEFTNGIAFATAITIAATTGLADNDTGAPATNDVVGTILYK